TRIERITARMERIARLRRRARRALQPSSSCKQPKMSAVVDAGDDAPTAAERSVPSALLSVQSVFEERGSPALLHHAAHAREAGEESPAQHRRHVVETDVEPHLRARGVPGNAPLGAIV